MDNKQHWLVWFQWNLCSLLRVTLLHLSDAELLKHSISLQLFSVVKNPRCETWAQRLWEHTGVKLHSKGFLVQWFLVVTGLILPQHTMPQSETEPVLPQRGQDKRKRRRYTLTRRDWSKPAAGAEGFRLFVLCHSALPHSQTAIYLISKPVSPIRWHSRASTVCHAYLLGARGWKGCSGTASSSCCVPQLRP